MIKIKHLKSHETKKHSLKKFLFVLTILAFYSIYLFFKFGNDGLSLLLITWSVFVMATPIPDAGFILDFPIRLLTGVKMIFSEIFVWSIAIGVNLYFLKFNPEIYNKTTITHVFYQILNKPWPDWIIIFISLLGTFLSLYFGDELLDIIIFRQRKKYFKHKKKYFIIVIFFILFLFYFLYRYFLSFFNLELN